MKQNVLKWYREIGFPETVVSTAADIIAQVETFYDMLFDGIFISNIRNGDQEEYTSLWLFSGQYVVECKDFLTRFDIDIVRYKDNIRYVSILTDRKESLTNPTHTSTMKLSVLLADSVRCLYDATGLNCMKLSEIAQLYLKGYKGAQ